VDDGGGVEGGESGGGEGGGLVTVGAGGCNKLVIAGFWSRFAADLDPLIAGIVGGPDEALAEKLELEADGFLSGADEDPVEAVVVATVDDASPWKVEDGFTTVPSLGVGDPVEVPVERDALEAAAFGFATSGCVVGGEGRGVTVATSGRFVSLWCGGSVFGVDVEGTCGCAGESKI
jgi:hypothetical protein